MNRAIVIFLVVALFFSLLFAIGRPVQIAAEKPVPPSNLRDGFGTMTNNQSTDIYIPVGVALTDVFVERVYGPDDPCPVLLFKLDNGVKNPLISLQPSSTDTIAEMHFKSGLRSSTVEEQLGFSAASVTVDCTVKLLWTGYEY